MFRKNFIACLIVFIAVSCSVLFADPVTMTMDDLNQIGDTQKGNNNKLGHAIELSGITDLGWVGDSWKDSKLSLLVWDTDSGIFCWDGPGELTHISVKAGNNWIMYELDTPLQSGGFISLASEIFDKKGKAKKIVNVTGYYSVSSVPVLADSSPSGPVASVPEPGTVFLLGIGLFVIPLYRKRLAS